MFPMASAPSRSTAAALLAATLAATAPRSAPAFTTIETFNNYTADGVVASWENATITPGSQGYRVQADGFGHLFEVIDPLDLSGNTDVLLDFTVNAGGANGTSLSVVLDDFTHQNTYQLSGLGAGNYRLRIPLDSPTAGGSADLSSIRAFQVQANSFDAGGQPTAYDIRINGLAATPKAVTKTYAKPIYMHYMPWFKTPEYHGTWGNHWNMNNANDPDTILTGFATGDPNLGPGERRDISSHYYPKIGPYASVDPDVIEYHLLLMKTAGIDGVIVDWYGEKGTNGDLTPLLEATNAIADKAAALGMAYSVMLEDRFAGGTQDVIDNVDYAQANYFDDAHYTRLPGRGEVLMTNFGPITQENPSQWDAILAGHDVDFLPLWYQSGEAGANADGEFQWFGSNNNPGDHLVNHLNFLQNLAPNLDEALGFAYPGFDSYYAQAGVNNGVTLDIPHDGGATLAAVLAQLAANDEHIDAVQLGTWNDFGEGTIFEPTLETGYDYLLEVQDFAGVPYDLDELALIFDLYTARKAFEGDAVKQGLLDQAVAAIVDLDYVKARRKVDLATGVIPEPSGTAILGLGLLLGHRRLARGR